MNTNTVNRELNQAAFASLLGMVTLLLPALGWSQGYTITTVAGQTGNGGFSGNGGPALAAKLNGPYGVALDSSGNLYIAEAGNDVVRKIGLNGIITTVAGSDSQGYSGDGGPATIAQLKGPVAVAVDTSGNLYIADTGNNVVRKVSGSGIITTVAGGGSGCAQQTDSEGDGCPATSAKLDVPSGVAVNAAGNLYIAERYRIREVSAGVITSAAGTGTFGFSGDGGLATKAALNFPQGLALDSAGNLYIADTDNEVIRKISTNGTISTVAGSNTLGYSGDGGAAVDAKLNAPEGVTVDSSGNIYIADTGNSRVREVLANGTITTIAGNGSCNGNSVFSGPAVNAELCDTVAGAAVNASGDVYVADQLLNRIFLLTPPPAVTIAQNAEGGSTTIAPNTWVAIKGSNLGPLYDSRIWQGPDFVNNQMPTQLDGVSVSMNGENAYVYYISPTQVNVLTPPDLVPGPVQVKVTTGGETSASFTATAQTESPSFFIFGAGPYVVGTHLNGGDLGPASLYPGLTTPAAPGELVILYANGFGSTTPSVVAGSETQSGSLPSLPVIQIGGITASVQFAGLVSPGLYQFNVVVPSSVPAGDNPITAQYNGLTTQTGVMLTVQ